ncbi:dicarboxylate/amino acid:cation symporter [Terricaulis sp.]|uniref:dicarboxylate/amino acid:cation symporter n=1 Tax=Terricaulis sp. TaxID=2768686 RepID=UPI00378394EF
MQRYLTWFVLLGLIAGIGVGYVLHEQQPAESWPEIAGYLKVVTDLFLRLIKMIIAPLVLSTLVVGIAHMGGTGSLGRVGVRTLLWFITASIFSLLLGLAMVHLLQPGVGLQLPIPEGGTAPEGSALNVKDFVVHLVPTSIFDAMATNSLLQIVVFSLFFGVGLASLGEEGTPVIDIAERVSHVMLRVTGYVMNFAPFAVFAAVAATITENGLEILGTYARFIGSFYLGLVVLWGVLILAGLLVVGFRVLKLLGLIRDPIVLAFSTASSEAAYPRTFEALQKFGVSKRIAGFVLPLGYSFNLDGSMMYCTFAVIFIAQVYGLELTWVQQLSMLLVLMVTSKGMAGVPRASLVVIAATLTQFGLPEAGLLLILGVDHFLDMGRSATNVVGNSIATAVVAKWEKELGKGPDDPVLPGSAAPKLEDQGDTEIGR